MPRHCTYRNQLPLLCQKCNQKATLVFPCILSILTHVHLLILIKMAKVPSIKQSITKEHNSVKIVDGVTVSVLYVHPLKVLYICTIFCDNIFDSFKAIEWRQFLN